MITKMKKHVKKGVKGPGIPQIGLGGWVSEDGGRGERERREEKRA
jgi:hypothetical protein